MRSKVYEFLFVAILLALGIPPTESHAQTNSVTIRPADFTQGRKTTESLGASKTDVTNINDNLNTYITTNNNTLNNLNNAIINEGNTLTSIDGRVTVEEKKAYSTTVGGDCNNCFNGTTTITGGGGTITGTLTESKESTSCSTKYGSGTYSGSVVETRNYTTSNGVRVAGSETQWAYLTDNCSTVTTKTQTIPCGTGLITQSQTTSVKLASGSTMTSAWTPACVTATTLCTPPKLLDTATNTCVTPTSVCPQGQLLDTVTNSCVTPEYPTCTPPQLLDTSSKTCVSPKSCVLPFLLNTSTNTCVLVCPTPTVPNADGSACVTPASGCTGQVVTWSVGSNTCSATTSTVSSGSSSTATDSNAPTTGSATFACTNGSWGAATSATCASSCASAPSGPQNFACSAWAGTNGIPLANTVGTFTITTETAACTGSVGTWLTSYAATACTAPGCASVPSAATPAACASYAGFHGIPAANTVGNFTYTTETASCRPGYGDGSWLSDTAAADCSAPVVCNSAPSAPATAACITYAGTHGIPSVNTVGAFTFTTETAACTGNVGSWLTNSATADCSSPGCTSIPSGDNAASCAAYAGSNGIPAANTVGTFTYKTETAACSANNGSWISDTSATGCSAPVCVSIPSVTTTGLCSISAGSFGIPAANTVGNVTYKTETAACTGNLGNVIVSTVDGSGCTAPVVPVVPVITYNPISQNLTCPTGTTGTWIQTATQTLTDGVVTSTSPWVDSTKTCELDKNPPAIGPCGDYTVDGLMTATCSGDGCGFLGQFEFVFSVNTSCPGAVETPATPTQTTTPNTWHAFLSNFDANPTIIGVSCPSPLVMTKVSQGPFTRVVDDPSLEPIWRPVFAANGYSDDQWYVNPVDPYTGAGSSSGNQLHRFTCR